MLRRRGESGHDHSADYELMVEEDDEEWIEEVTLGHRGRVDKDKEWRKMTGKR